MKNDVLCEKAVMYGEDALSDSELLTVLMGCGETVAVSLLEKFHDFHKLSGASARELQAVKGVGKATALKLKATLEIARRCRDVELRHGVLVNSSQQVFAHFHERLKNEKREKFYALLLDSKHRVMREELVSIGALNFSIVHPREVFRAAIREAAESIILLHNHPSHDPTPSQEDKEVTMRLKEVGKVVGIDILDHIIIGHGRYVSFAELGLI